jgi:hypothetical protein
MASIPAEIPVELHDKWSMWLAHYRASGSSPKRAQEEALATMRAHYLQEESGAVVARGRRVPAKGVGLFDPRRWQALCPHCGAVAHGDLACAQALRRLR